ncbi:hypothetical protein FF011L_00360 [Roseimaritima multifibrata]|uniref:Uncharacterized protein n=1 Tax=Roseimaritima multifibrata TaxID=1930274 RepID=A0A517M937_9BACT|nr:hypothetical protein [Roseimaritima multifibrata]QDS91307.1 hypothetical protein FF011L_00360 [Roseimaritima multifibrata]
MEVIAATVITSLLLIPSLSMLDQTKRLSNRLEIREHLVFEAERLLDFRKYELADDTPFMQAHGRISGTVSTGSLASRGLAQGRYQLTTIQDGTVSSSAMELLDLQIVAWNDVDGDRSLDPDEPSVHLVSKLMRPPL